MKKLLLATLALACTASVQALDFRLIRGNKPLQIYYDRSAEAQVVGTAVDIFSGDMKTVSGVGPDLTDEPADRALIVATLGKSPLVDKIIKDNGISTEEISGKWEAFKIMNVKAGKQTNLMVLGSDDRGTAYGVLELSRMLGVSPWEWWADVYPEKKYVLNFPDGYVKVDMPSVQYRGIFLNDEDWGLVPWSTKTFEPTDVKGEIGPETYSKIFELLLRLRANTIWPAMHEVTVPFFMVDGNREAAEKYGITIGNSHCEPMLRTNTGEWDTRKNGRFNFLTNRDAVVDYWTQRIRETKNSHNFITIGMRGVHDGKMEGVNTVQEYTDALTDVIATQRKIIAENINPDVTKVPQAFIPYKEVLEVYDNGIEVPDDVTLIWCDDNYGYLTRLSNPQEQQRSGGAGVYYHISYWGRPHDYLWLCSTPPAQIYSEMKRAWDYGARKIWILNVGDIKPAEYDIEFFMDLAWNIDMVDESNVYSHLDNWAAQIYGKKTGAAIASTMREYYRLAAFRKPEHMGWSQVEVAGVPGGKTPVTDTDYNTFMFGGELDRRLAEYDAIRGEINEILGKIPSNRTSSYYQLVHYPVNMATYMNEKLLYAQKARLLASHGLPVANAYSYLSGIAYDNIESQTRFYNETMNNGKWNGMMDFKPRNLPVYQRAPLPDSVAYLEGDAAITVWYDGAEAPLSGGETISAPKFVREANNDFFISLFSKNRQGISWSVVDCPEWLDVREVETYMRDETRIRFSVRWEMARSGVHTQKSCELVVGGVAYPIDASVITTGVQASGYETDGAAGFNAYNTVGRNGKGIKTNEGLGHSANAVSLPKGSELEYSVYTLSEGEAALRIYVQPTHPVNGGDLRVAVSFDGGEPVELSFATAFRSETWKQNVMRGQAVMETTVQTGKPGVHRIKVRALDDNVIVDQLMLDFKPGRKFYEVPVQNLELNEFYGLR